MEGGGTGVSALTTAGAASSSRFHLSSAPRQASPVAALSPRRRRGLGSGPRGLSTHPGGRATARLTSLPARWPARSPAHPSLKSRCYLAQRTDGRTDGRTAARAARAAGACAAGRCSPAAAASWRRDAGLPALGAKCDPATRPSVLGASAVGAAAFTQCPWGPSGPLALSLGVTLSVRLQKLSASRTIEDTFGSLVQALCWDCPFPCVSAPGEAASTARRPCPPAPPHPCRPHMPNIPVPPPPTPLLRSSAQLQAQERRHHGAQPTVRSEAGRCQPRAQPPVGSQALPASV
ncbi:atherin-like [Vulpes lagopus]|uniref:atherin-like n=1 Tax=Vulpes lagopus TaxID=494514 RepID=UPI001BC98B4A|nr:atherin-like [Vulpes lagopus]